MQNQLYVIVDDPACPVEQIASSTVHCDVLNADKQLFGPVSQEPLSA